MKFAKFLAATAASIVITGAASAAVIGPYTVDTKLGEDTINSGIENEIARLEELADLATGSLSEKEKFDSGVFGKDDDGNWFIDVNPNEPSYFVLKFGVGNLAVNTHYFFKNVPELTKLVWTDNQINNLLDNCTDSADYVVNGDECRLSHYSTGSPSAVPLPAAGWMLIAGVGGLVAMRRRKKS